MHRSLARHFRAATERERWFKSTAPFRSRLCRTDRLPQNHRLPPVYAELGEAGQTAAVLRGEFAREPILAVQGGEVLRLLMEKGLIRIAGRHDSLGRPVLYGTTKKFLQVFGLRSLRDLPQSELLRPPESKK